MNHDAPAYGLWGLVIIESAIFILFAFSFFKPRTKRDWRTFGGFASFVVALFVEMYGFPRPGTSWHPWTRSSGAGKISRSRLRSGGRLRRRAAQRTEHNRRGRKRTRIALSSTRLRAPRAARTGDATRTASSPAACKRSAPWS